MTDPWDRVLNVFKPSRVPNEQLDPEYDDGTMPANVEALESAVIGCRIRTVTKGDSGQFIIHLDDGRQVQLADTDDCCAYTTLENFLLNSNRVDHVITGVSTSEGYTKWHIYADAGDVLELDVDWSAGNPFYYGYGFDISVLG